MTSASSFLPCHTVTCDYRCRPGLETTILRGRIAGKKQSVRLGMHGPAIHLSSGKSLVPSLLHPLHSPPSNEYLQFVPPPPESFAHLHARTYPGTFLCTHLDTPPRNEQHCTHQSASTIQTRQILDFNTHCTDRYVWRTAWQWNGSCSPIKTYLVDEAEPLISQDLRIYIPRNIYMYNPKCLE